jgi:Domain of unknown function (DUF4424)
MKKLLLVSALALSCIPANANDSSAAVGLGGLELTQNAAISMDSEDLFISRERVAVKYRFTNTSAKDVETLVSFPLPPLPSETDGYPLEMSFPDWTTLDFKTLVDGEPAKLELREEVGLIGKPEVKDVARQLDKLGWPVRYWDDPNFYGKLDVLTKEQRAKFVAEGLLRIPEYDGDAVEPNWQVTTHVTRKQFFPAGKTISVEHSYKPVAGGSVGGMLNPETRKGNEFFREYQARYCVDKAFLAGFDRKIATQVSREKAKGEDGMGGFYSEIWLDYMLKSGANWKGPIKDFRLIVDKGKADSLVSFCMTGVKKIGPTLFEVRKMNFEPTDDLRILIVDFYSPEAD